MTRNAQEDKATAGPAERAFVLHPDIQTDRDRRDAATGLAEAVALAEALPGLEIVGSEIVSVRTPQPGTLFGSGKLEELGARFKAAEVGLVLVDGPVTPVQQRNLEKEWGVKLLDRTGLILEIFADRAATREGVLQVELAALSYQRTRLVRAWTHLERQRGGLGFVGGPGETQIEADRRAIDEAITRIRRQLDKVVKTRALHRASRAKVPFPVVALVGYTNAGKSTLFNRLTGAEVLVKDMLFATLDPTMRGVTLTTGQKIILSDTVGFISDLPTQLVAAFRATLEEVLSADLILHVRDISHPGSEEQAEDVEAILHDLGVADETPRLEVWNKMDLVPEDRRPALEVLAERRPEVLTLSAVTGAGLDQLVARVTEALDGVRTDETLHLAFSEGRRHAWLHEAHVVTAERQGEDGWEIDLRWTARQRAAFERL
ncbi:GTPase HflX [Tropicimonas sp. IMCC6043]|uniref:GTPase HflX n=1 Tax=Tropicimonas sp. IMCC6043 TaxID=2510645 RepID=UPI00101D3673|nr:GTPase HflX [Tropicimonas sp. IMCC6043]RYH10292.1 GTPase HflX [Tropicimonas sp. IMCC6043]